YRGISCRGDAEDAEVKPLVRESLLARICRGNPFPCTSPERIPAFEGARKDSRIGEILDPRFFSAFSASPRLKLKSLRSPSDIPTRGSLSIWKRRSFWSAGVSAAR